MTPLEDARFGTINVAAQSSPVVANTSSQKRTFSSPLTDLSSSLSAVDYPSKKIRTLEDQFASIEMAATTEITSADKSIRTAARLISYLPRTTRSSTHVSGAESRSSSPLSSAPTEQTLELDSTQDPKAFRSDKPRKFVSLPLRSSPALASPGPSMELTTQKNQPLALRNQRQQTQPRSAPMYKRINADFEARGLDEGCRIAVANTGLVRQVGVVRGASFREEGVIVGCRFVIG